MRIRTTAAVLGVVALVAVGGPARAASPHVLAATGDSITRAFDVNGSHVFKDAPAESWSTGTDAAVGSVLSRLGGAGQVTAYNDAVTGAKMSALDGQLTTAASQGADRVTVQMGANDVCTSGVGTMTPTATFSSQFDIALQHFFATNPQAVVSVSSIPNIYQLWSVLHTNRSAKLTWALLGECRSMLSSSATEAQRQQVLAQEQTDNAALAAVCAKYPTCRYDGGAVFAVQFSASQISTVDYFHPNVSGQATLAATAWSANPFPAG